MNHTTDIEENIKVDRVISAYGGGSELSRKWYITEVPFKEKSVQELKVVYRIKSNFSNYPAGLDYFSYYSERQFIYDLKPAGFWGDGTINEFTINVTKSNFLASDEIVVQGIEGLTFDEQLASKTIPNFDIKDSEDLIIKWDMSGL